MCMKLIWCDLLRYNTPYIMPRNMQPESDYEETTTQAQVKEYSLKQLVCPFQNYHCHKKKKKRTDKD